MMSIVKEDATEFASLLAHPIRTNAPTSPRLRILHVLNQLGTGGTEFGVLKVIQGLQEDPFEHAICAVRGMHSEFEVSVSLDGRCFLNNGSPHGFRLDVFPLYATMRRYRPHIVHSRNWGAIESILAGRLARVPVIIHSEHGYELDMLKGLPLRRRITRWFFYRLTDFLFTVTEDLRAYHSRQIGVNEKHLGVIPNGVDTERFRPQFDMRSAVRDRLGFPKDAIVLGAVGRLVPIKNHVQLLYAAAELRQRGVDVCLLLVGDGPELTRLKEMVRTTPSLTGQVVFAGAVQNVSEHLNAMDVFVLPSINEGMSNTLLEAMATALPVVATRTGGNPELVEDGLCGFLVPPNDSRGLIDKLDALCRDAELRVRVGRRARIRVEQMFSLDRMREAYRRLYLGLAREHRLLPVKET
jgi:sugar transferase (PEP-CTERM/EpsH1 system associated)